MSASMNIETQKIENADLTTDRVEAPLNYLAETAEKPVTFMYKTEGG